MRKKLFGMLLAMSLMICSTLPVFAGTISTDGGTADTTVSFTKGASFTVTIPANVALSYNAGTNKYEGSGIVSVEGSIAADKNVKVTVPTVVNLTTTEGGSTSGIVTYGTSGVTTNLSSEILSGINHDLSVTVPGNVEAGTWNGTLTFTVNLI